jgi:uncharacterized zinc-type alcohol dehydrogenase-like protein
LQLVVVYYIDNDLNLLLLSSPFTAAASELIGGARSVGGSSTGTPTTMAKMLEFAARHGIMPEVEHFPMSKVNEAISYLEAGKPRYRLVLDADFVNVQS